MRKTFVSVIILISCLSCGQNIEKSKKVDDYLKEMKSKSIEDIKVSIEKDTAYLNKLLKEFNNLEFSQVSLISASTDNNFEAKNITSEPVFEINKNVDEIKKSFNLYNQTTHLEQRFYKDIDGLDVGSFEINDDFEHYENRIQYNYKRIFSNGRIIKKEDIGLMQVDSALIQSTLEIPLEFEKIKINKNDSKAILYKSQNIEIDSIYTNQVELKISLELSNKVIGFQAVNKNNLLMNSNSFSSFPILTIRKDVINSIIKINQLLVKSLNENDKSDILSNLTRITQKEFDAKNDLGDFYDYFEILKKSKNDSISYNKIAEKGKKVIGIEKKYFTAQFPDNVESIILYTSTKNEIIIDERILKMHYDRFSKFYGEKNLFNVYSYKENKGLVDIKGNIIIPAKYYRLEKSNNYYYIEEKENGKFVLNWLDIINKKLVPLPQFSDFKLSIKENIDAFYNKEHNIGVLKNREEIILPFQYNDFYKLGDLFFAEKDYTAVDIFDKNLNKLPNKGFSDCELLSEKHQLIEIKKGDKFGIVNYKLDIIVPFKYDFGIRPFPKNDNLFIVIKQIEKDLFYGLINSKGEEITPLELCEIRYKESENKTVICKNGKYGFMDENGKIVIQPKFSECYDFNEGYSFVFTENSYGLINIKGDYVMKIDKKIDPRGRFQIKESGKKQIYCIDNLKYDYKGDLMKDQILYK